MARSKGPGEMLGFEGIGLTSPADLLEVAQTQAN